MPDNPNNLGQFWQELKRRKVVRVITVYAAATFVILELVSIIKEPLLLPDWTLALVIVLLCIGFIITVIFSWIYDITPEGLEKTKPVHEITEKVPKKPSGVNAWKIATIISVVIIVGLVIFHTVGERKQADDLTELEKSIAVLPFHNDSPDDENQHFINGTMEAILDNLCKIQDLKVMARTSVEQYRNAPKQITEIANELNVSYILEGSGQKYGEKIRLTVQLINGKNGSHIWSKPYDRDWKDILLIQSEIAQSVAAEIKAIITSEEKQLIEKIPTYNLTAYDFYQRGREEHIKYWSDTDDIAALERAEGFYTNALEYDSTFALAYAGLTWIYFDKNYSSTHLQNRILDSIMIRTDIVLSLDDQIEDAYLIRARMYELKGDFQQAEKNYEIALNINPNYSLGLRYAGLFYLNEIYDYVKGFSNLHKAANIDRSPYLAVILRTLVDKYRHFGFDDNADYYNQEATKLDNDSSAYYIHLSQKAYGDGNQTDKLNYRLKAYMFDTNNTNAINLLASAYGGQDDEEALRYWKKYLTLIKLRGEQIANHYYLKIGMCYWRNGYKEEANYYINEQIKICNRANELGDSDIVVMTRPVSYLRLAQVYAFLGDTDKTLENLRFLNQLERIPGWIVVQIARNRRFRDEPEAQQIITELETKYEAERERIRKWLIDNELLL